ncbi:MAG: phosphopantetheine-binding protein, partial [Bacteroidota bacterium]
YAFPYSWDVRIGHKERDAALDELNDQIDEAAMTEMLKEIGFPLEDLPSTEEKQLWVYYKASAPLQTSELRAYLKEFLPLALIPSHFVWMEDFPLNANGKIDKKALLQEDKPQSLTSEEAYLPPRNEIETLLANIWQEVLNIEKIGVKEDFLEMGGTSLTAIRIMARLNEYLELELELNSIFKYPNIEKFSLYIEETLRQLLEEEEDNP